MAIDGVPFEQIAESHLRALLEAPVPEGRTLDYKRDVYGPKENAEFAKDVSALANALGGHLVIGMDETGGVPTALDGIGAGVDPETEVGRLESIARDSLQPRLSRLAVKAVPLDGGRHAIVVRVGRSLNPPHRVLQTRRFHARATNGNYEPDVDQLRELFAMQPELLERVRGLQKGRLAAIGAGRLPIALEDEPGTIVVHVVPFGAFALGGHRVSGADLQANWNMLRPYKVSGGYNPHINFDGLLVWAPWNQRAIAYVQAHRNGIVESVSRGIVKEGYDRGVQRTVVYSDDLEINTVGLVLGQLKYLRQLDFSEPFVVLAALLGAANAQVDYDIRMRDDPLIGRDLLVFDEVIVEEAPRDELAAARLLRPIFDQLANAGGRATSQHFEPDGSWKLRTGA